MPRTIDSTFAAEKDKPVVQPINLYTIKLDPADDTTWRRYAEYDADITFDGNTYTKSSIKRESMELRKDGALSSLTITVPDITGTLWGYILQAKTNDTLRYARVEVKVVWANHLADASAYISDEFEIEEAIRTWPTITFRLQNPIIFDDVLPRSMWMKARCRHLFKGNRCKYAGADTTCERTIDACKAKSNLTNFGGVPTLKRVSL